MHKRFCLYYGINLTNMKKLLILFFISTLFTSANSMAQTYVSGAISSDTNWSLADSPYIVTGNILVPSGITLTIEPGVTVNVNSGLYIKIQGTLVANGNESNNIVFTSSSDSPIEGDWDKIWLNNTSTSFDANDNYISGTILNHCIISYANEGLRLDEGSSYIVNSQLSQNITGINFKKVVNSIIDNNNFNNNGAGTRSSGNDDNEIGSVTYTKFINNNFNYNSSHGLSLGGYGNNANNNLIKNNISINNGGDGFYFGWGDVVVGFADNTIEGNIIYNNSGNGITVGRDSNSIKKNFIIGNSGSGINISGTYIYEGLTIENNIISSNLNYGLDLSSNTNSVVRYNSILNSGGSLATPSVGIPDSYITSNNNTITFNTIDGSKNNAIELKYGPNNFNNNNFINTKGNYIFKLLNDNDSEINAENNYWGTSIESEIQAAIYDYTDDFELGVVDYTPFSTTPNTTAPISPPSSVIKVTSGADLVLSWTANEESDLQGYKLYYGNPTGYSYDNSIDLGNVTTYTISGGDISTEYAITAYDTSIDGTDDMVDGNESWYSRANTLPELPTNIVLEGAPRKSKLSWTASASDNVAYYEIYRGLSPEPTTLQFTTAAADSYYEDIDLTIGETFYYRIKVVDTNGNSSDFSADYSVTLPNSWVVSSETGSVDGFGSIENPFLSIQSAVDISINEDTVVVYPGTYQENVSMFEKIVSVTTPDPLNSASTTIIDGGNTGLPVFEINGNGSNLDGATGTLNLSGFTLKNGLSPTYEVAGGLLIKNTNSADINISISHLIIEDNTASNAAGGSYFYYTDFIEISDVIYRNNTGTSTMGAFNAKFSLDRGEFYNNSSGNTTFDFWHNSSNSQFSVIKNTLVRNNVGSGAFNIMDGIIINSTIVDNGSQINFRGSCALVNTIVSSGQFMSSEGLLEIRNSHIEDGQISVDIFSSFLTYENNLEGDIYFADVTNYDYSLSEYSPSIGAGVNSINLFNTEYVISSTTDLNSSERPLPEGTNVDIGAFENSLGANSHNSNIYVSINDGSNEGSVGLETAPFQTLQAAINYAFDGDTIYVLPGVYPGGASVINKGINFISTSPLGAILNSEVINSSALNFSSNTGIYYSSITGFDFLDLTSGQSDAIISYEQNYVSVYKSKFYGFRKALGAGISAIEAENCLFIYNNIIAHNDNCSTGGGNIIPQLKNCTIINSGQIHASCPTISINVVNSIIIIPNTDQNAYTSPPLFSKVITNDSNIVPQENSTWDIAPQGEIDIYFTDFANEDYSLQDFSPAIGYGYFPVSSDITGGDRPLPSGSSLDVGAYENVLGNPLNGAPRFDDIENTSTDEDAGSQAIDILNVVDGDILENQVLTFNVSTDNIDLFDSIEINYTPNNGSALLNYTPAENQNGVAEVSVTLTDDAGTEGGGIDSVSKSFTVTINPVNDPPIASDQTIIVDEAASAVVLENNEDSLLFNAIDVDQDELTAILETEPLHGSLTLNSNGTFIYTHDGSETTSDIFTYKANDGTNSNADSAIATVSITINPVNDAPVVFNHDLIVEEGGVATSLVNTETSLLFNATDIEEDDLVAVVETEPSHGILVLNPDGSFSYEHNGSDSLSDSFTYRADDSSLISNVGTVSISINPVNDNAPTDIILSNNSINENEESSEGIIIGEFTTLDLDLPSDSHSYQLVAGEGDTNNDSFVIEENNLKVFTPFDFENQNSLSFRVSSIDEENQSFEKIFTVEVININDISIESQVTNSYCEGDGADGSITILNTSNTTGDLSYSWSATNGGIIPSGLEDSQNLTGLTSGTYTLIISDATDFTYTENFEVSLVPQYTDLNICYVSSDTSNFTQNRIFLNYSNIYNAQKYQILREGVNVGEFDLIGEVNPSETSFLDETSNNNASSYSYKVRLLDGCGNLSIPNVAHKTILLQSSIATDNSVNLSWTEYQGVNYTSYIIYRSVNGAEFNELTSIASSNLSYNDIDADITENSYFYYVAISVDECETSISTGRMANSQSSSSVEIRSNQIELQGVTLDEDGDGVPDELDNCPGTTVGSTVDENGCFTLPSNNFSVEVISETCPDRNNGIITIEANEIHDYNVLLNGSTFEFSNNNLEITDLAPGFYTLCISVDGESFEQCYNVTIEEGITVSGRFAFETNSAYIQVHEGTPPYTVSVNNIEKFVTSMDSFDVDVKQGDVIEIKTANECEGVMFRTVDIGHKLMLHPNPTENNIELMLPNELSHIRMEILTLTSRTISSKVYKVNNGKANISLENLSSGMYFLKVFTNKPQIVKIIKK